MIRRAHEFPEAIRLAAEWMRIGETTRPYTELRLEEWMERPVTEVRAEILAPA